MEKIEGEVAYVIVQPGRPDLLGMRLAGREDEPGGNFLSPDEPGSSVTFDGARVDAAKLLARLLKAEGGARATLHPDAGRYGVSLRAEFVSCAPEGG